MTAIVYRVIPGHQRQYVARIVARRLMLWTDDVARAEHMTANDAHTIAYVLRLRSTGWNHTTGATEPPGEYGTEEIET